MIVSAVPRIIIMAEKVACVLVPEEHYKRVVRELHVYKHRCRYYERERELAANPLSLPPPMTRKIRHQHVLSEYQKSSEDDDDDDDDDDDKDGDGNDKFETINKALAAPRLMSMNQKKHVEMIESRRLLGMANWVQIESEPFVASQPTLARIFARTQSPSIRIRVNRHADVLLLRMWIASAAGMLIPPPGNHTLAPFDPEPKRIIFQGQNVTVTSGMAKESLLFRVGASSQCLSMVELLVSAAHVSIPGISIMQWSANAHCLNLQVVASCTGGAVEMHPNAPIWSSRCFVPLYSQLHHRKAKELHSDTHIFNVHGLCAETVENLDAMGIRTVGDLAKMTRAAIMTMLASMRKKKSKRCLVAAWQAARKINKGGGSAVQLQSPNMTVSGSPVSDMEDAVDKYLISEAELSLRCDEKFEQ